MGNIWSTSERDLTAQYSNRAESPVRDFIVGWILAVLAAWLYDAEKTGPSEKIRVYLGVR